MVAQGILVSLSSIICVLLELSRLPIVLSNECGKGSYGSNNYEDDPTAGSFGGACKCGDGKVYPVGGGSDCGSVAQNCVNGEQIGDCNKTSGIWSNKSVTCGQFSCHIGCWVPDVSPPTCDVCPVGSWCDGKTKQPCGAGKYGYSTAVGYESDCKICPAGSYCQGGASKIPCPAGTFGNVPRAISQLAGCPGTCPVGNHGVAPGQTTLNAACEPCPKGHYCPDYETIIPCPSGRWGNVSNATQLSACGFQCPLGRFGSVPGQSTMLTACPGKCESGTFGNSNMAGSLRTTQENACVQCTMGHYCLGGSIATPCPGGRYGAVPGSSSLTDGCAEPCPSGTYGNVPGQTTAGNACPQLCPQERRSSLMHKRARLCGQHALRVHRPTFVLVTMLKLPAHPENLVTTSTRQTSLGGVPAIALPVNMESRANGFKN